MQMLLNFLFKGKRIDKELDFEEVIKLQSVIICPDSDQFTAGNGKQYILLQVVLLLIYSFTYLEIFLFVVICKESFKKPVLRRRYMKPEKRHIIHNFTVGH